MDYIYDQPSTHDIEDALNSLPVDMHGTYIRILEKIDKQRPAMRTLAKRALLWVVAAGRPLTLKELEKAVAIEPTTTSYADLKSYEEQTVVNACGNFLMVDSNKLVRTVHYTVQEFLRATMSRAGIENPSLLQKYQVFMEDAHVELAHSSIQFLLFPEFQHADLKKVLGGYIGEFWDYHILACTQPYHRLHNIFADASQGEGQLYHVHTLHAMVGG